MRTTGQVNFMRLIRYPHCDYDDMVMAESSLKVMELQLGICLALKDEQNYTLY